MTSPYDLSAFTRNMTEVASQCQQIMHEFIARRRIDKPMDSGDPMHVSTAFFELFSRMLSDPSRLMEAQINFWQDYVKLWQSTTQRFLGEQTPPVIEADTKDKRFKDSAWQSSILFDFIKQSYLLSARWMQRTVSDVEGVDSRTAKKIDFYTRQFVDAMAPSNFLMTNPEVIKATMDSNGENLVKGLKNMLEDLERGEGTLRISMTDYDAFEVGKNLAITKGKVIYQNELMQLIQYSPATEKVHKAPVLIIPAWINKFYILDLQPENSYVKWLVERGYTVFMISWVNPDEKLGKKAFDDYLLEGPIAALDAIEKATGEKEINAIGYCLGGTLLSITLAYLAAKKQEKRIKSATFLTTMLDFSDAGELSVFIDEEQLKSLENKMESTGYLEGKDMAVTFNMLRANDLIWSFVVNNYLLGKDPFPFDLLYWNSDSTRMPAIMHSFYLRNMYQNNLLIKKGGIKLAGVPIDLSTVKTPAYFLSTREDHIAPWKSTYAGTKALGGPVRFVLAASGHIAGVVNAPHKKKYCHWVNDKNPATADAWINSSKEEAGSWWVNWNKWVHPFAGEMVKARKPGDGKLKPLADAPGSFVKVLV
jgi:polyhydroxyalkanoate synthase